MLSQAAKFHGHQSRGDITGLSVAERMFIIIVAIVASCTDCLLESWCGYSGKGAALSAVRPQSYGGPAGGVW